MTTVKSARLKVGMEIHVELRTRTKMFTRVGSPAHPEFAGAEPNTLIDPVVLALPGALPVPNREAIDLAMLVGLALGCTVASRTRWDRKSYFYPDLPKNYQISQLDQPLCFDGSIDVPDSDDPTCATTRCIKIIRAHLEEDAGKLLHEWPGGKAIDYSIVDLNRAGTPLLEVVTEPDFTSAAQAVSFAGMLRDICRFLGASEGNLEQGHMRFEPNINLLITLDDGREVATPIVEVKNLNSFRALRGAIEYEQIAQADRYLEDGKTLESGGKSTRGWDEQRSATVLQRVKEEADDYRYFPDPDLPPLEISQEWRDDVASRLPELPHKRAARYRSEYGLGAKEARALTDERGVCELFEQGVHEAQRLGTTGPAAGKAVANVLLQQGFKLAKERGVLAHQLGISAAQLGGAAALRAEDHIPASAIEPLLLRLAQTDETATDATKALNLAQVSDESQLKAWCDQVVGDPANAKAVEDVRSGKDAALGRLIGGVMQRSGGSARAARVREMLIETLRP